MIQTLDPIYPSVLSSPLHLPSPTKPTLQYSPSPSPKGQLFNPRKLFSPTLNLPKKTWKNSSPTKQNVTPQASKTTHPPRKPEEGEEHRKPTFPKGVIFRK